MDVIEIIKKQKNISFLDLCNQLDQSPQKTLEELEKLKEKGYNVAFNPDKEIIIADTIPVQPAVEIDTAEYFGNDWIRFGVIADTHLCSKYARLDVLEALYDVFQREGIRDVYLAGNWIDGEAKFNKFDVVCIGVENQISYFLNNFPKRQGIITNILSGDDHEGWYVQREGINIGKVLQDRAKDAGRTDIIDIGYMERDFCFKRGDGKSTIRIIHPGGGSAYAVSYQPQKYVEALQGGEKPSMVIAGHWHKYDWCYPREVNFLSCGCVQDQTPFMRKKRLQAMVGGCIVEIKQDSHGIFVRNRVEWMPFYDKKFYQYRF
jgi:hypothetical protein